MTVADLPAAALFELAPLDPDPVIGARPVGTVLEVTAGAYGLATATYDPVGQYRYRLSRVWDAAATGRCVFVMLNPSTATAHTLDQTVTRCIRFAERWGFGALEVVNIFAYRSTDPAGLYGHDDPVGPGNDDALVAAAAAADLVVAAWGVHGELGGRGPRVRSLFADAGVDLHHLRLTKGGHPGHPLYLPAASTPTPWPAR